MCGVIGIVSLDGSPVEPFELEVMSTQLEHRGPDENGFVLSEQRRVGLGHLRLSVIDLVSGQQPMYNEDGSVVVSFNGEIYDYTRHTEELKKHGHVFRTSSDTEVIVHMYEEYGDSFLDHIDGQFAILLWDERRRLFLAARDRSGIKPLYYLRTSRDVIFASEMKAILALDRVAAEFDSGYVQALALGLYAPGRTLFRGIASLKPANLLEIEHGSVHPERAFWRQHYRPDDTLSFEDAKSELKTLLRRSVRRRVVADIPVGLYLSSGVDSALISAFMSEHVRKIDAFHFSFASADCDESGAAREIAEYLGITFHRIDVDSSKLVDRLAETLWHTEMPIWNLHAVAKRLLSRFVKDSGVSVCLTGEGADECFAGYPFFLQEALIKTINSGRAGAANARELLARFYESERASKGILWDEWRDWKGVPGAESFPSFHRTRAWQSATLAKRVLRTKATGTELYGNPDMLFEAMVRKEGRELLDSRNVSRAISREVMHQYIIPALGDRVEMASSVECRTPFLDREVLEFSGRVPPAYLVGEQSLTGKRLLREIADPLLPSLLDSQKRPFLSPGWSSVVDLPRGRELFDDYMSKHSLRANDVVDGDYVHLLYRLWSTGKSRRNPALDLLMGMVLSLQILRDLYLTSRRFPGQLIALRDRTLRRKKN